jgi:hypothetical protein
VPESLTDEDFEDEDHKTWLACLEQAARAGSSYQFVRAGREPLIAQALDLLDRIAEQRASTQSGPPHVLIDTHRKDQRYAYALAAGLAQRLPDLELDFTKDAEGADG